MMEQQRMEQQRIEQQRMEQQRMEQQRIEEQNRMAGMSQMSEMSQQQSFSQTTTSSSQMSSSQVYESQQFGGGIMKGYKSKGLEQPPQQQMMNQQMSQINQQMNQQMSQMMNSHEKQIKDAGIFGGITGDHNSLVEDNDMMDYQKHSVKSLVGHFSKVRPKTEIPVQYLPEQKLYGGEQGPSLNYLTTSSDQTDATHQSFMRAGAAAGGAKQDIDASRQEYEMRKQRQEEQQQTSSSTVEMRSKTETSTEQRAVVSERRQSLSQALLMDPATQHASAGIIDPSAILRGTNGEESRSKSEGLLANTQQGESSLNKWDNHNTIARGWAGAKTNYRPVTFRAIYNVESQKA